MHDLISSIAARLERGADRMANAGDLARERLLRAAAEVVRCERDLGETLELERLLLQRPAAEAAARIVAFAAAEYASAPADTTSDFTVDTSDRTPNVPVTTDPSKAPPPQPDVPMKTVLLPTFPVEIPAQVPETYEEGPQEQHTHDGKPYQKELIEQEPPVEGAP